MELREDNPYAYSVEILFDEGDSMLERAPLIISPDPTDTRHRVQQYDTLSDLSGKYYRSSKWWWVIADTNNLINPLELEVGSILIIPDLKRVKALL
jgi:nucleoid-associated protein YgaU